ncbi:sensor histidine kinase [Paenibacillus sp. MBLB4367]|uniref:sensor histidine kinase n=1 Tax=Paenibacillus sp. MBLB4367 TaxID=3384767 RepID=UPI00390804A2
MRAATACVLIWISLLTLFGSQTVHAADRAGGLQAMRGELDLSQWEPERDGIVELKGEWAFYWNRLIEPGGFGPNGYPADTPGLESVPYAAVPHVWKNDRAPEADGITSSEGFATYRLLVKAPDRLRDHNLSLYVPSVASAYKLWINGKLAAWNGVVGTAREQMVPKNLPKTVALGSAGEYELILQVSNFVQRKGGMWEALQLGEEQQVFGGMVRRMASELFIIGSLTVMGLYHISLYIMRRNERSPFYFGVLCLMIAIRALFQGEAIAVKLMPAFPWELSVKLEYIPTDVAVLMVLLFVHSQYPLEAKAAVNRWYGLFTWSYMLFILLAPARVYTKLMLPLQLMAVVVFLYVTIVFIRAFIRKRHGSLNNLIGLTVFFASIINDILFYNNVLATGDWIPFGLLVFLFAQTINLALTFSKSFARVEGLTVELQSANRSLEDKVRERTATLEEKKRELEDANGVLSRMEQSRRRLLSNISHELGTPLTTVRGYIKAMIDGVVKVGDPVYLQLIYDKTVFLDRMIGDLFELSKLEGRQIRFEFREAEVEQLIRRLFAKFELDMRDRKLAYELGPIIEPVRDRTAFAAVDPIRIEQVYGNLLVNAQKNTPAGGKIRIETEWAAGDGRQGSVTIKVIDTGRGIAEDELPFLFDRFYKGRVSQKQETYGVGLGLAISKEIVSCHDGEIGVRSKLGEGSVFYFTLPVRYVHAAELQSASAKEEA